MMRLCVLLIAIALCPKAWSFPENVRHGYFSCTACDVSPSGGGVLTPYGKSLSAELMSTWGSSKSSGFVFTDNENEKINLPWLRDNVFVRGVQTYRNSPTTESAKFIPMQEDFEGGVDIEKFAVIGSFGLRAVSPKTTPLNQVFSRRHYFLYRISEKWNARVGKFMFAFGLNGPDHITATRRGLGWNQGTESYNAEVSYLGEKSSTILTVLTNAPEENGIKKDKGVALTQNFLIGEHSKAGFNLYYGQQSDFNRVVFGPSWVLSFTEKLFLNSEVFGQSEKIKSTRQTQNGYATFHRLNYQAVKGMTPFVQFDRAYLDRSSPATQLDSYGLGLQWLPYPHFELTGLYGKEKSYGQNATDFAWLMIHLYL